MIAIKRLLILVNLLLLMLHSCSNKSLSYFFDGVSMEDSSQSAAVVNHSTLPADSTFGGITKETVIIGEASIYHADFRQKKCEKCHQIEHGYRLKERQPDLCYQCHKNINDQYKKIHGPVAAGFCSTCHEPHKSQFTALLKMPVRDICQHCHEPGDVAKNEAHQKISITECLVCHNPHGGDSNNLLRTKK